MAVSNAPFRQEDDAVGVHSLVLERVNARDRLALLKIDDSDGAVAQALHVQQVVLHEGVLPAGREDDVMGSVGGGNGLEKPGFFQVTADVEDVQVPRHAGGDKEFFGFFVELDDKGRTKVNAERVDPLGRLGASEYVSFGEKIRLSRPS